MPSDARSPRTAEAAPEPGSGEEPPGIEVLDAELLTGPTAHAAVAPRGARALQAARGAAIVASTGFVAGAAAAVLVAHRTRPRRRPALRRGDVLGTRSFLVDVHLLVDR